MEHREPSLVEEYSAALLQHLTRPGEETLHRAYELGRATIEADLAAPDLAQLHQEALLRVCPDASTPEEKEQVVRRSCAFLADALGPFEMLHRGFVDSNAHLQEANRRLDENVRELEKVISGARCILWSAIVERSGDGFDWRARPRDEKASQEFLALDVDLDEDYNAAWRRSVHLEDVPRMDMKANMALRDGLPGYSQEYRCVDRQGSQLWLREDVTIEPVDEDRWNVTGVVTDITQIKRDELLRRTLHEIAEAVHATDDLQEFYRVVHERLSTLIDARNFYIALPHPDDVDVFEIPYCVDEQEEDVPEGWLRLGKSRTARVLRTGRPLLLTERETMEMVESEELELRGTPGAGWLGIPLISGGHTIGAMAVLSYDNGRCYSERDMDTLTLVAQQIATAITRKRTQERLAREEYLFSTLMEVAPNSIYFKDAQHRLMRVSKIYGENRGISSPDEAVGKTDFDFFTEEEACRGRDEERKILETGAPLIADLQQYRREDGADEWTLVTKIPLYDEEGEVSGLLGINQRITELIQTQQALKDSEERFRSAFEAAPVGIAIVDPEGRIVQANDALLGRAQYTKEDFTGRHFQELVHEDDLDMCLQLFQETLHGDRDGSRLEVRLHRKDGEVEWVDVASEAVRDADGTFRYSVAITQFITERKLAEGALQVSEARSRALIESTHDAVVITNGQGNIVLWNAAAEKIFGYTEEEILGQSHLRIVPERYREASRGGVKRVGAGGSSRIAGKLAELEGLRKDGTEFPIEISLSTWRAQEQIYHSSIIRDATDRKRTQNQLVHANRRLEATLEELRSSQQQIVRQERLRALGQMASGISHDFNNALSPILGFSDLLLMRPENLEDAEKTTRYLRLIHTAARDAGSIVARMREFYRERVEGDFLTTVDLDAVINEAVSLTQPKWKDEAQASGRDIRVVADVRGTPSILGDPTELRETLTNLVFNACDAMPEGGKISLRAYADGDHVVLEVADTGLGMSPDVRNQCLDPFFTTKDEHGTGMGLAMVYGAVQRHGATLDIESEEGEGTTFILRFPAPKKASVEKKAAGEETSQEALRVLVVEDEPLVREVIVAYLDGDGHQVEAVEDGSHGLAVFSAEAFDLVITDRAMPGMSGDQVAAAVKERAPDVPVIMLTGFGALMETRPEGVDAVVAKPVTLDELRAAIATVMNP